jgi:hypothetical protein
MIIESSNAERETVDVMNPTPSEPTDQQPTAKPGKIRTWWHPLPANLLH